MYLLGDIGNTEIKIFLLDKSFKIKKRWNLSSRILTNDYLHTKIKLSYNEKLKIKKILFSSVVPRVFKLIKKFLKKKINKTKVFELKQINLKKLIKLKVNKNKLAQID